MYAYTASWSTVGLNMVKDPAIQPSHWVITIGDLQPLLSQGLEGPQLATYTTYSPLPAGC